MTTTLWIISGIAVATLVGGIVATIVVKIDKVPNWRKVSFVLLCFVGLLLFKLVIFGIYHQYKEKPTTTATSSGITVVQPKERWEFTWRLPPGQTSIGRNSHTMEVEITKSDNDSLWAVLHDQNNGVDVSVGGLRLSKVNGDLIGTWTNYLSDDGGKCYLYKEANGLWSGQEELKNGRRTYCTLKRK